MDGKWKRRAGYRISEVAQSRLQCEERETKNEREIAGIVQIQTYELNILENNNTPLWYAVPRMWHQTGGTKLRCVAVVVEHRKCVFALSTNGTYLSAQRRAMASSSFLSTTIAF